MAFEGGEQGLAQKRTSRQQSRQERIPVVAAQGSIFQGSDKSPGTLNQGSASCDVPLVLWSQREGDVGKPRGDESQFISDGTHGPNLKIAVLELLPFTALHFAAASQDQCAL